LVLLRTGFTVPQTVASCAVRSYRTLSPLPVRPFLTKETPSAVYSLLHFPWVHTPQALPGVPPYGARTFLVPRYSKITVHAIAQPAQADNHNKRLKESQLEIDKFFIIDQSFNFSGTKWHGCNERNKGTVFAPQYPHSRTAYAYIDHF